MPELPEVETIRRGLKSLIKGQRLKAVKVLCEKSFVGNPNFWQETGSDLEILEIRRFGKALVLDLAGGNSLLIHLRMTGQLIFDEAKKEETSSLVSENVGRQREGKDKLASQLTDGTRFAAGHPSENFVASLPNKQTRVILELENGTLFFNDQRKFGFIKLLPTAEVENDDFVRKLAKEPWQMTALEFHEKLEKHRKAPVKSVILDQTILCGLGNIYADESLFLSKIHPEEKAGNLTLEKTELLLENARAVMEKSIASGGSTMATYVKPDGTRGNYLDLFAQVYHRDGQPCLNCGTIILKTKVGGRGTHFCPRCQILEADTKVKERKVISNQNGKRN